jgi:AraC-like DNA-binding protein
LRRWTKPGFSDPCGSFQIPPPPERQLFAADLSLVILTLKEEHAGREEAASDSAARRLSSALQALKVSAGSVKPSLRDLASALEISPNYLGRLFRRRAGIGLAQYMSMTRLFLAADLLRRQVIPVKEVARSVGYGDTSGFCRDFRNAYGSTPASFGAASDGQP